MSDRGSNILKASEGQNVLFCFGHKINNVLQRSFYQIKLKHDKNETSSVTPSKRRSNFQDSSEEEVNSDDDKIFKNTITMKTI